MEFLTVIPGEETFKHIVFNSGGENVRRRLFVDTGFFAATSDGHLIYQHLNNSIPDLKEMDTIGGSEKGGKRVLLKNIFKKQ